MREKKAHCRRMGGLKKEGNINDLSVLGTMELMTCRRGLDPRI